MGGVFTDTFKLLSKKMQQRIWAMKWEYFTPVQDQTIPLIMQTDSDIIVSANTASGKTEAAFLPIITKIEDRAQKELKALYISPLKALINNQFDRIERLCQHCEINIYRWHGDVGQSHKNKLLKSPSGILQITPESLESLFINKTGYLKPLFQGIEFIVIDEIHSFLDSQRGTQLRSLLSRMETYTRVRPRIIGLSATIRNFTLVKQWVNYHRPEEVKVVEASDEGKELQYSLLHFPAGKEGKIPLGLFEDLREVTREYQSLIFCNSRGTVEETTVTLNRLAEKEGIQEGYFAHHSSIDKAEREYVEKRLATSRTPQSIVCTSSLELGIDIGALDLVCQLDTTFTVSSLKQRMGRSGRRQEDAQILQMYTTSEDSLVQSIAVMKLLLEGWIEPAAGYPVPYDIAFHQIISLCQEYNGMTWSQLLHILEKNAAFYKLSKQDMVNLINHMVMTEMLEIVPGHNEYIVGLEGERLLRGKDFYSVFMVALYYEVYCGMRKIGQLDKGVRFDIGENVILAGKLWTIKDMDTKKNKIFVQAAVNAKKPKYLSDPGKIDRKIAETMVNVLCSEEQFQYLDAKATECLSSTRRKYSMYHVSANQRIAWEEREVLVFEPFAGTVICNTLIWLLRAVSGLDIKRRPSQIERIVLPKDVVFSDLIDRIRNRVWEEADLVLFIRENEWLVTRYSPYLTDELQQKMHLKSELDLKGALDFLESYQFVTISLTE
ncbi:DEAD/DEAH box helicase [Desulfosporosinus sp. Sb-LF]|uniref:DEAD/DEAH box helicase n=1 Tax=Desulfosporosinus sp. Sb-LF TaxID=2560027 RepID=UPI00107EFB27|nr:DEAD/DEAH box helicase [Desulfosporosinus sp. Sb-LF]TGE31558.1 DEAD/DEAH box helicase [Desulfosporosinus sp. Sb-LF]